MSTTTRIFLATVALALATTAGVAHAGRGGSASRIRNAVQSGSVDAIVAEVERTERLTCPGCIETVTDLLDDDRYQVREVAAWWFAKRPVLAQQMRDRSITDVAGTDSRLARNGADFLGTLRHPSAIPALSAAATRAALDAEARRAAVRALGTIGHPNADPALTAAMRDADAGVRLQAVTAWLDIRSQRGAAPAVALIGDGDAAVRAKAAGVVGELREASARAALEAALAGDADPSVRRNAAWALGRIGDRASQPALEAAMNDRSPLVGGVARAALAALH